MAAAGEPARRSHERDAPFAALGRRAPLAVVAVLGRAAREAVAARRRAAAADAGDGRARDAGRRLPARDLPPDVPGHRLRVAGPARATRFESQRFTDFPTVVETLKAGRLDATFMIAPLAMKLREQGVPVKIAYLGHRDGSTVMVRKDLPAKIAARTSRAARSRSPASTATRTW